MNRVISLSEFFITQYVHYACYDNTRKISSYVDGLKSGSRKVTYTIIEKNIKDPLKVSQLASKVAEFAEYIHASLDGVVVTMGQDYCGTNNLPLIKKKGNFGTRMTPTAAAARYIFASGSDDFFKLFDSEDLPILENQYFEGSKVEPKFYLPALPILLINGSDGVSSGFAQKILPRNPENIKAAVLEYIQTGEVSQELLKPWFRDFKGTIEQGENSKQWLIKGTVKRISPNKVQIEELPAYYDLKEYLDVLNKLQDSGVISDYKDLSSVEFSFVVTMPRAKLDAMSNEDLLNELKLVKKTTENYTCMDEDNSVITFDSVEEILKRYVDIKLRYLEKRKQHNITLFTENLQILQDKIRFLELVISGAVQVSNRKTADIEVDLVANGFSKVNNTWDHLLGMKIWNLTQENLDKLSSQYAKDAKYLKRYQKLSVQDIWKQNIDKLELS